ncbi:hypothetical protein ACFPVX_22405 [Cohnella faecalis]|uniref:GGDEF domain-containing protein n=1 Tax=Cohnella faecalis TaxID=2315694 RepID=A0A398CL47_9BACL|nr:hypothetical protein [Cohnella faecalis]RIE00351.1 hypothetical protein D3H35_28420 [Cohnella faecalis]
MLNLPSRPDENKDIPIGLVGAPELIEPIVLVLRSFPSFRPIVRPAECDEDTVRCAEELLSEVEVLFMTDPDAFRLVKEKLPSPVPMHYLPLSGAGFFKAICRVLMQTVQSSLPLAGVTVDTFPEETVRHMIKGTDPSLSGMIHICDADRSSIEEIYEFHARHYRNGSSSASLSANRRVAERLEQSGVPCVYIEPADNDIVIALERALLSTETRRSKESQIVVGMVVVDNFDSVIRSRASEHEVQKLRLDVQRTMLDFIERLDGYLTPLGPNEFLFFTTRGLFERETGGYKYISLASQAQKRFGLSLSIGIGFGLSANVAGTNARAALRSTKDAGGGTCFIVREDQTFIGPLEMSEPLQYDLSFRDAELLKKVEEAGLTTAYLSRLFASASRHGKLDYTAVELAALLDLTTRSANRLLVQWADAGLAEPREMRKAGRGRPTQVYVFTFMREHLSEHGISLRS